MAGRAAAVLCASALLASCASTGSGTRSGSGTGEETRPDAVASTPPMLAAAVLAHYDEPVVAIAPLLRGRHSYPTLPRGGIGAELAFDRSEGDNTHVRVIVSPPPVSKAPTPDPPPCKVSECTDISTEDVQARLFWETGSPEEDPGLVYATAEAGDHVLLVLAYGPLITERHDETDVLALGEAVAAVATDPAVGLRTSEAYAGAGEELCDDSAWVAWFGRGNGSPRPPGYVDWCADAD